MLSPLDLGDHHQGVHPKPHLYNYFTGALGDVNKQCTRHPGKAREQNIISARFTLRMIHWPVKSPNSKLNFHASNLDQAQILDLSP